MNIISGLARSLELEVPEGLTVRPTAGRGRKALFDAIGPAIAGQQVTDLCAGSGALGLEAASRGAATVLFVEVNRRHLQVLQRNAQKVRKTGVEAELIFVEGSAAEVERYASKLIRCDYLFADPPYADSFKLFRALRENPLFLSRFAGAKFFWELPDTPGETGNFLTLKGMQQWTIRRLGGTGFLCGTVAP